MKIVWDEKKNTVNQNIHKIDFNDAVEVFSDPFQLDIDDPDHSWDEQRLILLGRTKKGFTFSCRFHIPRRFHQNYQCKKSDRSRAEEI